MTTAATKLSRPRPAPATSDSSQRAKARSWGDLGQGREQVDGGEAPEPLEPVADERPLGETGRWRRDGELARREPRGEVADDMSPRDMVMTIRMASSLVQTYLTAAEVSAQIQAALRLLLNGLRPR